jgi:tRNA-specific adenosine deaminase 1
MKCLPVSKLAIAHGNVLHDSHAEIIAVRAFNRFLLDQCLLLALDPSATSNYVQRRDPDTATEASPQPFTLHEDVTIHMYGSEAPCGDASMELIMAAQDDATPWELPRVQDLDTDLKGRGSFAELGIVRRKPARPDAPPTLSKSCTDKLTMYQFTSLLSSLVSLLVVPDRAYLSTLTIPESQYVETAVSRAFSTEGRLRGVELETEDLYQFLPFEVQTTTVDFAWSRRAVTEGQRAIASNVTAAFTPDFSETLINGVLQGRKLGDPRGASKISRRSQWSRALEVGDLLHSSGIEDALHADSYETMKTSDIFEGRRRVKDHVIQKALKGWKRNTGDVQFSLIRDS